MYRKILVIVEEKETDEAVLAHIQTLATQPFVSFGQATKTEITLLRVVTIADDGGGGLGLIFQLEPGASGWRRKNQAETYLPRLERRLREVGVCVETALVISTQSEADAIVRYAAENGHDLIAMASDSRPWYRRWIGGSPASGVLRKATVPVLFVRDGARKAPTDHTPPEENVVLAVLGSASL